MLLFLHVCNLFSNLFHILSWISKMDRVVTCLKYNNSTVGYSPLRLFLLGISSRKMFIYLLYTQTSHDGRS